jgi:small subunit ribosomal protein S3
MGQKVHPVGFRLGITRTWDSRWFANKDYAALVYEDHKIRRFIKKKLEHAGVAKWRSSARRTGLRSASTPPAPAS